MVASTLQFLTEQVDLSEQLLVGRGVMFEPQDLPGRYGRVVARLDHVLEAIGASALVAGGWAVWRYGFYGRMTQDIDIVVAADAVEELLRVAAVSGFSMLPVPPGRWPKLIHKETDIKVDLLPEGARPGTAAHPAPTTIPHPSKLGATGASSKLEYIELEGLIELKLAASRPRDEADVAELIRANPDQVDRIRDHLANVHRYYVLAFDRLADRVRDQHDD